MGYCADTGSEDARSTEIAFLQACRLQERVSIVLRVLLSSGI
jgi:hypothetical protein